MHALRHMAPITNLTPTLNTFVHSQTIMWDNPLLIQSNIQWRPILQAVRTQAIVHNF